MKIMPVKLPQFCSDHSAISEVFAGFRNACGFVLGEIRKPSHTFSREGVLHPSKVVGLHIYV